ncbi:MAG: HAMP domain-containing protein [Nitrospirae bacterium]|nr:HAMP domain-containing protein [Nitrospirota bacterium]
MLVNKSFNSLTGKLILTIGTLMLAGSVLFWLFLFKHQEKELLASSVKYGYSFVDYIRNSTRYGMLTVQGTLIQQTVEAVGIAEGIMNVRIFDNRGKVAYSSDKKHVGTMLDKSSALCLRCHTASGPTKDTPSWTITKGDQYRILNIVQPIYNEPACYNASCHAHPKEQRVLGLVEADLSLELLDHSIKQQGVAITVYVLAFSIVISGTLCIILWNFVSTPVTMLAQGMRKVAAGDLDYKITINRKDEIGELANTFNTMSDELRKAKNESMQWSSTLEKKVQEKTEAIHRAQQQLIHSEKLASLGRMAAGVAHEINSPLTGIVTFGHLLLKKFPEGSEDREDIEVIIDQANRCSNIIKGLLGFARATTADKAQTNINDVLNSTLNIVKNKADFFNIKLSTNLDPALSMIKADAPQLQQVFLNMIVNAADACEGKGSITITTSNVNDNGQDFVQIEFRDTGYGIKDEDLEKIFEPFFTTKPVGKGTGLGLAVSHGIIQEHGGKITISTKIGEGTSFFIRLPAMKETA